MSLSIATLALPRFLEAALVGAGYKDLEDLDGVDAEELAADLKIARGTAEDVIRQAEYRRGESLSFTYIRADISQLDHHHAGRPPLSRSPHHSQPLHSSANKQSPPRHRTSQAGPPAVKPSIGSSLQHGLPRSRAYGSVWSWKLHHRQGVANRRCFYGRQSVRDRRMSRC